MRLQDVKWPEPSRLKSWSKVEVIDPAEAHPLRPTCIFRKGDGERYAVVEWFGGARYFDCPLEFACAIKDFREITT
jgi:hypothetical protein